MYAVHHVRRRFRGAMSLVIMEKWQLESNFFQQMNSRSCNLKFITCDTLKTFAAMYDVALEDIV